MPITYLDPKNDLTFRKIFGDHPRLLISFLNALLPFDQGREIVSIEYLDADLLPELPGLKRSVVDVRCVDNRDRQFIVEMQMYWTSSFKSRMMFNTSKAYVRQLFKKEQFSELRPVYGLSLVNEDFMKGENMASTYYHHYRMVHNIDSKEVIPGIELIFVELQKFKALKFTDRRLQVLWLKFLTLIDESTTEIPEELRSDANISEALDHLLYSSFSNQELDYYDKYWDAIRIEKSSIADAIEKAEATVKLAEESVKQAEAREATALALAEKERVEKEKERADKESALAEKEKSRLALVNLVKRMKSKGFTDEEIAENTGLTLNEIRDILS